ncbi:MAG: glutamate-5-semialdehyde dehydrogenase [Pirellula sp.]|jgi:glutamate-5-semialdehyde dehydrogenase|nr:glutamate-5-semialdehyde dehydrogenase [Pirellula sp.]
MSSLQTETDIAGYCRAIAGQAKAASRQLLSVSTDLKNRWLRASSERILRGVDGILAANEIDLQQAEQLGLTAAQRDRLLLDPKRVEQIALGLVEVAELPDPVHEVLEESVRPSGIKVSKIRVPLGVIFFIYESRPNVTADAAAIAVKSGNAIILRGGKEAAHSSRALVDILRHTAVEIGIPVDAVQLIETHDRNAVGHLLQLSEFIDLVIPRGGEGLIRRVVAEATMPVLKHYDGNCHVYVDAKADLNKAIRIVENSKCQRMGVCNAMESLVVHQSVLSQFLPLLEQQLQRYDLEYRADERAIRCLTNGKPATESDWSKEYLGPIMSVKVVDSLEEAIEHINRYSSKHTEAIVTEDRQAAYQFQRDIDSSAVVLNASTRFNDGGQLGLGAEIGISTDKFHARGPCGLKELTTYKYVVVGDGHIRT